jgi:hypothetical protein
MVACVCTLNFVFYFFVKHLKFCLIAQKSNKEIYLYLIHFYLINKIVGGSNLITQFVYVEKVNLLLDNILISSV